MFKCDVDGLDESIRDFTDEYRDIDDMNQGTPAFVINAGFEAARRAFASVHLDGENDERPTVTRIQYGYADWGLEIAGSYRQLQWFEYGTGIAGKNDPHPTASKDGYVYDKNNHGEAGWDYEMSDGTSVHTRGIVGCRGIYKAQVAMEKAIKRPSRRRKG